jgi:hypothetical protein
MESSEGIDGVLVVRHDSTAWMKWTMAAAFVLLVVAAGDFWTNSRWTERIEACLGAAGTLVVIGLAASESGRFAFDRRRRVVDWERRWAWWRRAGTIAFADVADVRAETPIGDHGEPSRRIVLVLADGSLVPLRAGYVADGAGAVAAIAERIRAQLGKPAQENAPRQSSAPASPDAVAALVRAGRTIDAIKELRRARGLSLRDAKREVDALRETAQSESARS